MMRCWCDLTHCEQCVGESGPMHAKERRYHGGSKCKQRIDSNETSHRLRVYMDYHKLNASTEKDHFPMSIMDQMLDRLAGKGWYYFPDGYPGYNQISIAP